MMLFQNLNHMYDQKVEDRILELIVLKVTNKISSEQMQELQILQEIPGVKEYIQKLDDKNYLVQEIQTIERLSAKKEQVWERMMNQEGKVRKINTIWKRLAIAASFIIVLSLCAYLFLFRETKQDNQLAATRAGMVQDILPPEGTAYLTLADGTKVPLNGQNAQNGVLSDQGGSLVKNAGENGLVYEQGATAAKDVYNTITTPRGVMFSVTLADGTKAWLNTASSIRYPAAFVGAERKVSVTGEVYFEVAKDARRPFIVRVNDDVDVRVLGTHFNVNAYSNETAIKTTLIQGKVEVSVAGSAEKKVLKPGQQARVNEIGKSVDLVSNVDLSTVMAWRQDKFMFQALTIREIMNQLQRYYDIEVAYEGQIPEDHFVAAMPRSLPISRILQVLQKTERVNFRIENRKVIVAP